MKINTISYFILYVLLSFTVQATGDDWWDNHWKYRRGLSAHNNSTDRLPSGTPVRLSIDIVEREITGKVRDNFNDIRVIYNGKPLPVYIEHHPTIKGRCYIWFRTTNDIDGKDTDGNYWLYYGNKDADPNFAKGEEVFTIFDDFKGNTLNNKLWEKASSIELKSGDDGLVIAGIDKGSDGIKLKKMPDLDNFCLETALKYEKSGGVCKFFITLQMKEDKRDANEDEKKRILSYIKELGDDSWDVRKRAEESLIAMGKIAIPYVEDAISSSDAEVETRAERILDTLKAQYPPPNVRLGAFINDNGRAESYSFAYGNRLVYNFRLMTDGKITFKLARYKNGKVDMYTDGNKVPLDNIKGELYSIALEVERDEDVRFRQIILQPLRIYPIPDAEAQLTLGDEEKGENY